MRVLVQRSELPGIWTAQALEIDACGQGETIDAAVESVRLMVEILRGSQPPPAPAEFFAELRRIEKVGKPVDPDLAKADPANHVPNVLAIWIDEGMTTQSTVAA